MKIFLNYLLPPLFYLSVLLAGSMFTSQGLLDWYPAINKPSFTPPGSLIGTVWTVIYILTSVSLIIYIKAGKGRPLFNGTVMLYVFNGIVNAAWSYIFFSKHQPGLAVLDALLILITVCMMIVFTWKYSKISSVLLVPYFLWVSFATYLTYAIYRLN